MPTPFGLYGLYYDLLYQDKNYSSEAAYVGALLKAHGISGSKLLEFGSGTGKHAQSLARLGFEVTGIERSPSMISMSRQNGHHQIIEGDVRQCRVRGLFDGVISLFHVMSYQTEEDDITAVFQNASGHLEPRGLFLFDFWHTQAVKAQKPESRLKTMRSEEIEIIRRATPRTRNERNIVEIHYAIEIQDLKTRKRYSFEEDHIMRHFSVEELDGYAAKVGMTRILSQEFCSGRPPGQETWSVCSLYRKEKK